MVSDLQGRAPAHACAAAADAASLEFAPYIHGSFCLEATLRKAVHTDMPCQQ